eukprot:2607429-Pyramimonas_sp.AAC.1
MGAILCLVDGASGDRGVLARSRRGRRPASTARRRCERGGVSPIGFVAAPGSTIALRSIVVS